LLGQDDGHGVGHSIILFNVPHMVRTVEEFVSQKMIYSSQRGQVRDKGNADLSSFRAAFG
jgi:hypothetical protein